MQVIASHLIVGDASANGILRGREAAGGFYLNHAFRWTSPWRQRLLHHRNHNTAEVNTTTHTTAAALLCPRLSILEPWPKTLTPFRY